jgi:hypothetical protein
VRARPWTPPTQSSTPPLPKHLHVGLHEWLGTPRADGAGPVTCCFRRRRARAIFCESERLELVLVVDLADQRLYPAGNNKVPRSPSSLGAGAPHAHHLSLLFADLAHAGCCRRVLPFSRTSSGMGIGWSLSGPLLVLCFSSMRGSRPSSHAGGTPWMCARRRDVRRTSW